VIEERGTAEKGARAQNRLRIVDLVRQLGPLSQTELSQRTGLSRVTVSSVIAELREHGWLENTSGSTPKGRPPLLSGLNPSKGAVVGISLAPRYIQVALGDLGMQLTTQTSRLLPNMVRESDEKALATLLQTTASMVDQVLKEGGIDRSHVIGVGMALPAPVNRVKDVLGATDFVPGSKHFHPARDMAERLDLPVVAENDANVCALAEAALGVARGFSHVVYVKVSTGVGCGLMIDGKLYRGQTGTAGELGHMAVDEVGVICYCGNRGCLHTVVGAAAIANLVRNTHSDRLDALKSSWNDRLISPAVQGLDESILFEIIRWAQDEENPDPACRRAIEEVGKRLGAAVGSICNLLNAGCVVVGGTLSNAGEILLQPLREEVGRNTSKLSGVTVEVIPAGLPQGEAEVLGALTLALREPEPRFSTRLRALLDHTSFNSTHSGPPPAPA
jgi:predicted NBD/HSP70 family sugar kinase